MTTEQKHPSEFIVPLSINGLHGRVLAIPSAKKTRKREILLVYGHHSSLERMFTIALSLSEYGNVTMPDLPGFGGMDSFYKIGEEPNLDNMADYLATFIKLKYKKRTITIAAMSWGFLVATRMLQKYPELCKQVDLYISFVGFTHKDEFKVSTKYQLFGKTLARTFSGPVSSKIFRYVFLQPFVIKSIYRLQAKSHPKMQGADKQELAKRLNFEVVLWHCNDVRTYMYTNYVMLTLNLLDYPVDLPVVHVRVDSDQYFDNKKVEKNLAKIFTKVISAKAHLPNHAPTIIDDVDQAGAIIPASVRKMLARKP